MVATQLDYWYDFLETSRAFAIDKEKVGAFVAQLRKEKGMTQKGVAERLNVLDKVQSWIEKLVTPSELLIWQRLKAEQESLLDKNWSPERLNDGYREG